MVTCSVADVNQQGKDVGSHSAGKKRVEGVANPGERNHFLFRKFGENAVTSGTCGIRFGDGDLVQRFFKVIK